MVDDEGNFNLAKDLEEPERLLAKEPQLNVTEIQMHSVIINTKPIIHTQLMSPLYGVFKTSKPCKVDRDIISPESYIGNGDELLENWMLPVEELDLEDSEHGLEHVVSSLYQANSGESSILILLLFYYFMYNRDIVQIKWGIGVELSLDLFLLSIF
ncbi:hypothetical protein Tco_0918477 [Tanacetum coccineum]